MNSKRQDMKITRLVSSLLFLLYAKKRGKKAFCPHTNKKKGAVKKAESRRKANMMVLRQVGLHQ